MKHKQTHHRCLLFASGKWQTVVVGNCPFVDCRREGGIMNGQQLNWKKARNLGNDKKIKQKTQTNSLSLPSLCKWQVADSGCGWLFTLWTERWRVALWRWTDNNLIEKTGWEFHSFCNNHQFSHTDVQWISYILWILNGWLLCDSHKFCSHISDLNTHLLV